MSCRLACCGDSAWMGGVSCLVLEDIFDTSYGAPWNRIECRCFIMREHRTAKHSTAQQQQSTGRQSRGTAAPALLSCWSCPPPQTDGWRRESWMPLGLSGKQRDRSRCRTTREISSPMLSALGVVHPGNSNNNPPAVMVMMMEMASSVFSTRAAPASLPSPPTLWSFPTRGSLQMLCLFQVSRAELS